MNSLHLFAGIGGGILADVILGHRVVGAVEIVPYCRTILRQHQEDGFLPPFPVFEDVRTFDYEQYVGKIDLVCGGFPCQDISSAGAGRGLQGSKSRLFYELVRVCNGIRPRFIFLENSPRITSRGLDSVLKEIASIGYDAEWTTLSAGKCGAPHMRDRWWCLCKRRDVSTEEAREEISEIDEWWRRCLQRTEYKTDCQSYGEGVCSYPESSQFKRTCDNDKLVEVSRAGTEHRCETSNAIAKYDREFDEQNSGEDLARDENSGGIDSVAKAGWWATKPRVGRLVNEFPGRVDALKGLGNAQVPVTAALAFYLLLRRFG